MFGSGKLNLVERPGLGRIGRPIRIRANFFEINSTDDVNIHHYDVIITPEVPPTLNRRIFTQFEALHAGDVKPVFDGRRNIFTARPLPFGYTDTFDIRLPDSSTTRLPRAFKLIIRKVAAVGRSFYTNQISQACSGGLEIWQGYRQSVRPTPGRMMINVDVSSTAFYESCELVHMVAKILGRNLGDLRREIVDRDRLKLEKALKYLKIRVTHRGDNSERTYKIIKLTNTPASNTKFEVDGTRTDVASYFQNTYNEPLQYPFLPCVVVRRDLYLPLEVCKVVEGQHHIRKLNVRQKADMIKFSLQQPQVCANKIVQGLEILGYRLNDCMRQFGLVEPEEMAVVPARVLPAPKILYHPSSRTPAFIPRNGSWNLRDKKVATGATLSSWSCVVFGNFRMQVVQYFIRELVNVCLDTEMNIPTKNPPIFQGNPQGNIEQILRQAWVKAGNMTRSPPQLILCILPNTGVPLYAEIKRVSDTVIGVATQCVQSRHIFQAKKQYCANLCLKMNVKLGGMNSYIEPSCIQFITQRPTIVMGACVSHPAPGGDESRPSIAALCASMDAKASRYAASIRVQAESVLFYRNGVSDNQFQQVLDFEIEAVRCACASLDANYKPSITFVVVKSRHHTRLFPKDKKDSDRTGNCLVGTVVESTITHPFEFDFYLQRHAATQGASRPTHYYVLCDENRFNADSIQTLSYNLCYSFARCTRAVFIVPPVYYAHLVCCRARFHSRNENWSDQDPESGVLVSSFGMVKPNLQKVMYFI
ncbi:3602_t:CDS:2 [Funneliformis mosseae]|uniref:3602_t:CDS:1 n=1 Tax=Funneliformis mosseae TaxID=27381 RepID=A0A9N9C7G9_FUNMO|nr:3602_t:CDS:2 [Funneliformis mosseae]